MKKSRKIIVVLLALALLILLALSAFWWWMNLIPAGTEMAENGEGDPEPDRPFVECESKVDLHSYYEEEGFGTNDCGDYGQIEITEWNEDGATGTAVDWNGREVEFY